MADCPPISIIEAIVAGEAVDDVVMSHVEACADCAARLETAREERAFLDGVRPLVEPRLAPAGAPRIAGYEIGDVISTGAQGVVYRGVQTATSREVAIKTLVAIGEEQWRLAREAEIGARLRHPGIVTVLESRTLDDGRLAVVMEFVDGLPLDTWAASKGRDEVIGVVMQLCAAIHHAHLNGVIHRDLKPENILVSSAGAPTVLDFGIARGERIGRTRTGEFAGTPAYASPEQASGDPEAVDALTDVYALGVILYRLLTGEMPYTLDGSIMAMARTIQETPPKPPRAHDATIPGDLEAIVLGALRKDRALRYRSAADLERDLERFLAGHPVEIRGASGLYLLRKAISVNRVALSWVAVALLIVAVAGVVAVIAVQREAQQRAETRRERIHTRAVTELLREALPAADPAHPDVGAAVSAGLIRLYARLESGAYADEPELDQAIRRLWGSVYTGLGSGRATALVEYAEVSLRNGLIRLRSEHGSADHADVAATLHELGGVLFVRGRFDEARRHARDAYEMRRRLLGEDDRAVGATVALVARIELAAGNGNAAVDAANEALRIVGPPADAASALDRAAMLVVKAAAALEGGRLDEAETHLDRALRFRFAHLPPDADDVLHTLDLAASFVEIAPNATLARTLSISWREEPLADAIRSDVDLIRRSRAELFRWSVTPGATGAFERVVSLHATLLGADAPSMIDALTALAQAAWGELRHDVRGDAMRRVATLLEARLGAGDPAVLASLDEAATAMAFSGDAKTAAALAERVVAGRVATPEAARDALLLAEARRRHAWYLEMDGRHAAARELYRDAIGAFEDEVGADHYLVALAEAGLAMCDAGMDAISAALALSEQALETAERAPSTPPDTLAHIRFVRGHVLVLAGRVDEARRPIEDAWFGFYDAGGAALPWRAVLAADLESIRGTNPTPPEGQEDPPRR